MKRLIKFRAKGKSDGQWHYGSLLQIGDDYYIATNKEDAFEMCVVDPETIGQFTGYIDYPIVQIYEGDILHFINDDDDSSNLDESCYLFNKTVHVVDFDDYGFWVRGVQDKKSKQFFRIPLWDALNENDCFDVIGNIHDNPELKKGGCK